MIIIWFYYYKNNLSNNNVWININYFVSNKNRNTWREKNIWFKKWDEIEIFFLIKNNENYIKEILFNLDNFLQQNNLSLSWAKANIENNTIEWNWTKIIRITWTTNSNGTIWKDLNIPINFINKWKQNINNSSQSSLIDTKNITPKEKINIKLNIEFSSNSIISDFDNLIAITWSWFESLKSIWIWEKIFDIETKDWKWFIFIPQKTFSNGEYFTFGILKKWWEIISLDKSIKVTYQNSKLIIKNIFPPIVKNDTDRRITLQWLGLKNTLWVQLSDNTIIQKTDFNLVSNSVIAVKIPKWLSPWKYNFNIMTIDWIFEIKDIYLEIN